MIDLSKCEHKFPTSIKLGNRTTSLLHSYDIVICPLLSVFLSLSKIDGTPCDVQAVLDVRIEIVAALGEDGITRWLD